MADRTKLPNADDIVKLFDTLYEKCLDGIPVVSPPVSDLVADYLDKDPDPAKACRSMHRNQVIKCTTSGVITGFGGLITMPVTIPANLGSVLYVQMRMIAATAQMAGYDLKCDQTQTLVYACLAGVSITEVFKGFGVQLGEKLAVGMIKKIPGTALKRINQRLGFRFVTKFGQKGMVNLGKLVPVVGAAVNGGFDYIETQVLAKRAYTWLFEGDFEAYATNLGENDESDDASEAECTVPSE